MSVGQGYECDSRTADAESLFSKRQYAALTGRTRGADDVIAYHLRQSFVPGEVTPEEANRIGCELAKRFTDGNHAFIACTHIDKYHIHNHIIWNSMSLDCTRKFRNFWGNTRAVRRLNDTLCIENGLSIVENPKYHGKSYNKWLGDRVKPSNRELLRVAIDTALAQKPAYFDALLKLLQDAGYEIKPGKIPALRGKNQKRFIRLDTLGNGYSEAELRAVLSGEKAHQPRKKIVWPAPDKKVNLLVDIQAKIRARKGVGYERWAKVFNLKQMAQTLNYLTEHNLLEYNALVAKAASATARYNELSAQIKAAEKRLAAIAVLKTQIINYAKTRDTYVAYRKAGYSKKFLAGHEGDILLHKAAKKVFDELGVKKLPTVKSLQAEYAALLAEKKVTYADYRKARDEMKEILTVKANVDHLLGTGRREAEKEKEHGQR
ncbi:Relaxase/mobilization nuclease domain protein [Clostridium ljungdahlii]|uniref:Relaxase/mobilization nuclease domain protein n=1 Tax=Clostridium ljungdahlii TaxID=1538 RepID=A0A162L5W7_9CLOT|nr:relaxase/mobilization nuclease domain-containing protein [Clostridium ljungdahlii]OAA84838.1 Relaxase/mobilization nuclease domain protein [Clostridium ljungdahlii]